jgi:hypothetical protein
MNGRSDLRRTWGTDGARLWRICSEIRWRAHWNLRGLGHLGVSQNEEVQLSLSN